ncbi:MAG: hypothetical protein V1722_01595 [Candidatus Micrarchaeota archaeon]
MIELPAFGMRAYALFFSRHGISEAFKQSELDWIVSEPMRKKIFALLLNSGWISKISKTEYKCTSPENAVKGILEFRVPEALKKATMSYAMTGLSAVELWSDYSYVQRGIERSPYFIKVLKRDVKKWQRYLNAASITNYVLKGSTIGEFVILQPVAKLNFIEKDGFKVEPLKETVKTASANYLYTYAFGYIKKKYKGDF